MNKIILVAAAAGLMSLAACNKSADSGAVDSNAEMVNENAMDTVADNAVETADSTSNAMVANAMDSATASNATGNAQ